MSFIDENGSIVDPYRNFIHVSRYSRWLEDKGRRETWVETVDRYINFMRGHLVSNYNYDENNKIFEEVREAVLNHKVMPSMRAMMTAGPALERDNVAAYNCSFIAVDSLRAFDEAMYILMNGTGVGFSVESKYISSLPAIADELYPTETTIVVEDSKLGWSKAYKELIGLLVTGQVPNWDVSKVRPAGTPLKTFGGRASGPEPLQDLFRFITEIFKNAAGRKLKCIEAHDIVCKIAEIVVVGGVRRSALISLSDLTDEQMRHAKSGNWWEQNAQRALANNSVSYKEKPDVGTFMREWLALYDSKSGERGIYNAMSAMKQVESLNVDEEQRREPRPDFGTNPCSEIILRSREFCNLSEVVIRKSDNLESLKNKVKIATILGTFQSTLTNYKYLSKEWKRNCDEERLLGVSLTGIMDNDLTNGKKGKKKLTEALEELREVAVQTNKEWAEKLGINQSAAITCVKPSGTVSQLVDSASGIHARHNDYYIRTVRADNKDPLCKFMKDAEFPNEPDVMKPQHTTVFSFPMKSPEGCVMRNDMTAIEQMELWLAYQTHWCEHKPSVTISVKEDEWPEVGSWVYNHFDRISGISFLPFSEHTYRQAPYQDCTEEEYLNALDAMPKNVDWSKLADFEKEDFTVGSQELACSSSSGGCEVVDL